MLLLFYVYYGAEWYLFNAHAASPFHLGVGIYLLLL